MKKIILILLFLSVSPQIYSQWQQIWSSSQISYNTISGWLGFEKRGDEWDKRFYTLDSTQFCIMNEGFTQSPEYIYYFNDAERLAGLQIYSLKHDLNGDGITDFYVLAYYGMSPYRQSFKIFDITSGDIIFEKNDPSHYFSYPVLSDVNGDGLVECLVMCFDYPYFNHYTYEVYGTGTTGTAEENIPPQFELMQNYPNPFNPSTTITYNLNETQAVNITIYDVLGNRIKTLVNGVKETGNHEVTWDGTNDNKIRQATGVYIYQLKSGSQTSVKKMIILK